MFFGSIEDVASYIFHLLWFFGASLFKDRVLTCSLLLRAAEIQLLGIARFLPGRALVAQLVT